MIRNINKIKLTFNMLSFRERAVVFVCFVSGLYFILDFCILQKVAIRKNSLDLRMQEARSKIVALSEKEREIKNAVMEDPEIKNKNSFGEMKKNIKKYRYDIEILKGIFTDEDNVDLVLSEFYKMAKDVKINSFYYMDLKPFNSKESGIYKYRFNASLSGTFFGVYEYIKKIESSNLSIYIDEMHYDVDDHPNANVLMSAFLLIDKSSIERVSDHEND